MLKRTSGQVKALFIGVMILVFVLVLAGCAGTGPTPPTEEQGSTQPAQPSAETEEPAASTEPAAPTEPVASADPQKLMIPRWFLASLTLNGQPVEVMPDQQGVTIQFEPGGKVNGTGGCNNFSATFQADYDGSMRFGPVVSTKMFCEGTMELENAYFEALSKVERFSTDDGLVLSSADGQTKISLRMPPK